MTKQLSEQEWIDLFNSNLPEVALPPGLAEGIQQRVLAEVNDTLKPLQSEFVEVAPEPAVTESAATLPRMQDMPGRRSSTATTEVMDRIARWLAGLRLGPSLAFAAATAAVLLLAIFLLPSLLGEMTAPDSARRGTQPTILPTIPPDLAPVEGTMIVSGGSVSIRSATGATRRYDGAMRVSFVAGDTIVTESGGATLRFFSRQSTLLQPGSEVEIVTLDNADDGTQIVLRVAAGETYHIVEKELTALDVFEVRADLLTARVTGTEFDVNVYSETEAVVAVESGEVLLTTTDGQWQYVEADQMAVVTSGAPLVVKQIVDSKSDPLREPTIAVAAAATLTPTRSPTLQSSATPIERAPTRTPSASGTGVETESAPSVVDPLVDIAADSAGLPVGQPTVTPSATPPVTATRSRSTATPTDGAAVAAAAQSTATGTKAVPPTATATATVTATPRLTYTNTPHPTATALPGVIATATATRPAPTATATPTRMPTNTPVPTATNTPLPTSTATSAPSNTPSSTPTNSPTSTPSRTPTAVPTATETATPVPSAPNTPLPTSTATNTPVPLDLAPVIRNEAGLTVVEDTAKTIPVLVNDRDPEGASLRVTAVTDGAFGTTAVNLVDSTVTYVPNPDYVGPDSFTYTVTDGVNNATGIVSLVVEPVNDPPTFSPATTQITVAEDSDESVVPGWARAISAGPADEADQPLRFTLTVADDAAAPASALLVEPPTIDARSGDLTIRVRPDVVGATRYSVRLSDGAAESEPYPLEIVVTPINDAPSFELTLSEISVAEDSGEQSHSVVQNLSAGPVDEQAQTLGFAVTVSAPELFAALPEIAVSTGAMRFTPAPDATGSAVVTVVLEDSAGGRSAPQTLTIVIAPVNDPPAAGADAFTIDEDGSQNAALFMSNGGEPDLDPEGSDLRVIRTLGREDAVGVEQVLSSGAHVTVGADGAMTYVAADYLNALAAGQVITDAFTYTIADEMGATAVGRVTVVVMGRNDPPHAADDGFVHMTGAVLTANLLLDHGAGPDVDPDAGDLLQLATVNGSAVPDSPLLLASGARLTARPDGTIVYEPGEQTLAGSVDSFTYTVVDRAGAASNQATVTILLDPIQN